MKMDKLSAGTLILSSVAVLGTLLYLMTQNTQNTQNIQNSESSQAPDHELSWITGCWQTVDGGTREVWTAGSDTHLFGHSVTMKEGAVVFFENLNLIKTEDGHVLSAYPMGKGPSDFARVASSANSITFQNPAHDYPQRIAYHGDGNSLTGTISMVDGSKPNEWKYIRCGR